MNTYLITSDGEEKHSPKQKDFIKDIDKSHSVPLKYREDLGNSMENSQSIDERQQNQSSEPTNPGDGTHKSKSLPEGQKKDLHEDSDIQHSGSERQKQKQTYNTTAQGSVGQSEPERRVSRRPSKRWLASKRKTTSF